MDTEKEYPVRLTCHDMHTDFGSTAWNQVQIRQGMVCNGFWVIDVAREGVYEFSVRRWPLETDMPLNSAVESTVPVPGGNGYPAGKAVNYVRALMQIGDQIKEVKVEKDAKEIKFNFEMKPGITRLQTWLTDDKGIVRGAYYIYVKCI